MKPVWKYILIAFFTSLVLGYLVYSLWYFSGTDKENVCHKLEIIFNDGDKAQLINQQDVARILEENNLNPVGKTIKYISTENIEVALHKNPMIKTVECYKTPSGVVFIKLQQRCPKLRVVGLGSYYIDTDRKPMPVSQNYAAYVPVVSGNVTVTMASGIIFDFVTFLEKNTFWNAQIEQINVRDDKKIELVPRVGDGIILLGTFDNYEKKLEKLHKLYVNGFNTIGWNRYKLIDLEYKDQVVCNKTGIIVKTPIVTDSIEKKDSIIARKL
ncbi:MAG: cell division protein FtsQ [Paludibacter sp.]|nr:cell division protein FtsQ [Paludibacter sp.]